MIGTAYRSKTLIIHTKQKTNNLQYTPYMYNVKR